MTIDFALDWIEHQVDDGRFSVASCAEARPRQPLEQLGVLRPLLLAASIIGDKIEAGVLARMLGMSERQLAAPLEAARRQGYLRSCGWSAALHFEFIDQGLMFGLVESIAPARKCELFRRAAAAVAEGAQSAPLELAVRVAGLYEHAGDGAAAARWWRIAAERAAIEASTKLASEYLRRALLIFDVGGAASPEDELAILSLLGPMEAQLHGSGSSKVAAIYARCLEIAERFDAVETAQRFDVLWGLNACILVHGRVETARELGRKLLHSAEASKDGAKLILATRLEGIGRMLAGELGPAIRAFGEVGRLYVFSDHAGLRHRYASDQAAVALAHKAWAQAIAGDTAASELSSTAALDQAQRLHHPHTSAHVACVLAARAVLLQQRHVVAPLATAARMLARQHRFPYWHAWADIILGWHEAGRHSKAGTARLEQAIAAYQVTGAGQLLPFAQMLSAGLALSAGDDAAAMQAADLGLEYGQAHGVALFDAELLRIKAQALGWDFGRRALLEEAHTIARRQGAGLFESRVAAMLAGVSVPNSVPVDR